jgi:ABC-2 type transport system ATP-binding protein
LRVEQQGRSVAAIGEGPVLARTAAALVARGVEPADLRVERDSLEDVFLALTRPAETEADAGARAS